MKWFRATVRLACLVETIGLVRYTDSVHVFRAADYELAYERALAIGRTHEESYVNGEGERVRWILTTVTTLDVLGSEIADGSEVCSGPVAPSKNEKFPFDHVFASAQNHPTQSIGLV